MAIKMASVAPTTERAPFMPHAQATICGAVRLSNRNPVGIGIPNARPIGTSIATATATRQPRDSGIAQVTIGDRAAER